MTHRIIGLLHPGEMGAAVGAELVRAGHRVMWCPAGRGSATTKRATAANLESVSSLAELAGTAEIIFSVCPPAAAEAVAHEVADAGFGGLFVDANAISPERMRRVAELVRDASATVVDGSIIGPPPAGGRACRIYFSGPDGDVRQLVGLLPDSPAGTIALGDTPGQASALKIAFGSFQKISRALAAVSHGVADEYAVTDALLAEAQRMGLVALAERHAIANTAAKAWRWGPEMQEGADTCHALGLPGELCAGAVSVFDRWNADKDDSTLTELEALSHPRAR